MDSIQTINSAGSMTTPQGAESSSENDHDKAIDVAKKFEALLLFTMMKSMRASLSEDTLAGSDQQDMYREMMDRQIAESIAEAGGLGMQKMLVNQLSPANDTSKESQDGQFTAQALSVDRSILNNSSTAVDLGLLTRHRMLQSVLSE